MTVVYVEVENMNSEVTNISLRQLRNSYVKAILDDPKIDLSKLNHYTLKQDKNSEDYHFVYDEAKYNEIVKEKEKAKAIEEGNKKFEEMQSDLVLKHATDKEAYTMRYLYEVWRPNTNYETGDRRLHNDILYKCKQPHTSEEQHTPDLIPAIWDIINGEPEKGTKDNPISVPEEVSSMVYVKGKYYSEGGVLYLMNRDGMQDGEEVSLTYKPSQLAGQYFVKVE